MFNGRLQVFIGETLNFQVMFVFYHNQLFLFQIQCHRFLISYCVIPIPITSALYWSAYMWQPIANHIHPHLQFAY